jgi:DNA-binding transcriptional ArsR family regulator
VFERSDAWGNQYGKLRWCTERRLVEFGLGLAMTLPVVSRLIRLDYTPLGDSPPPPALDPPIGAGSSRTAIRQAAQPGWPTATPGLHDRQVTTYLWWRHERRVSGTRRPTRRAILDELSERDRQTLFEICARLTTKHGLGSTRQAISQHPDVPESADLVKTRREGRYKFHHLDTTPLETILERWRPTRKRGSRWGSTSPRCSWTTRGRKFQRLRRLGVRFIQEPVEMGDVMTVVFDDTCGNLIQIAKA